MKKLVIGILAHVDAGKTTLVEAMLYQSGILRQLGRVDKGNSFLDTNALERTRGITIFSKQVVFTMEDVLVTLLDTPGHVDFSAEMERTLQVLDYAILVISAADGVQGHTQTLWRLLKKYEIPVFLFINKMDQEGSSKEEILKQLQKQLAEGCVDFSDKNKEDFLENIAVCEEEALEQFLVSGNLSKAEIASLFLKRKIFPCFFGSALYLEGVEAFQKGIAEYTKKVNYKKEFAAKVFKITRDEHGNRLTYMKVTGGKLSVKETIVKTKEKVDQIRIYSGDKYTTCKEAIAGDICAVTGLEDTKAGDALGAEEGMWKPLLEPVLHYRVRLPKDCEIAQILPKLKQLEEEDPLLHISFEEKEKEIKVQLMGEIQMEILKSLIRERFLIEIGFEKGSIVYKETIVDRVEGVGHFEPLRHYAEVHLLLEPLERGGGLQFTIACSNDNLAKNWQRLIMTHLAEKEHKGVLTGASITDMRITLIAGGEHKKHTEGGDFRQATYRAVRQGLKQAESILLEPYYAFRLEVPEEMIGRAMTDIDRMYGEFVAPIRKGNVAILEGKVAVAAIYGYQKEMLSYTKGRGKLSCDFCGYDTCHNEQEVISESTYDSERDVENPTGSVFCAHGAGFLVPWHQVFNYMHIEGSTEKEVEEENIFLKEGYKREVQDGFIGDDEIERIMSRTFYANKKEDTLLQRSIRLRKAENTMVSESSTKKKEKALEEYFLVDGYNVIYAWEDLKELAVSNMEGARGKLMDELCNFQGMKYCNVMVVFDAYRVKGRQAETLNYQNIQVVFTKEAETADQYIERFAHCNAKKYNITVVTSDYMEQIITRGAGCNILSARELKEEIKRETTILYQSNEHMI